MTKPGTIRWKIVPSKNFFRTSAAKDDVVHGESFTSRLIVNEPRLVTTSNRMRSTGRNNENVTSLPLVRQGLFVACLAFPPPQPASTSAARISGSREARAKAR